MKSYNATCQLDLSAQTDGIALSCTNYNPEILRSYYTDPACWVQLPDSTQLGIKHKTNPSTVYIIQLIQGDKKEAKVEKLSYEELKASQLSKFKLETKFPGEMDFQECIEARGSIGYNIKYADILLHRNPYNTTVLDSKFWYLGSISRNQKDHLWWVEACNGTYGFIETPAKNITRVINYQNHEVLIFDEKGQAYSVTSFTKDPKIVKLCSAMQICHVGPILKPHQAFFYTTDGTNCLTIWKTPNFSRAIKFLEFKNVLPTIKPVSTHNGKLFFVSQKGIEVCKTTTWQTETLLPLEQDDLPSRLLLSFNQRQLIYINRKGINILALGDDALFYAKKYLFNECQLYNIANIVVSYVKENYDAEYAYEFYPQPAYDDPRSLQEDPYEALASCKFLDSIPCHLSQLTKDILVTLLNKTKIMLPAKEEALENIDALLFLFFLYEKFPKNFITDNINRVLNEFPKILSSENSSDLKGLFDKYSALDSHEIRQRYIGLFECKASSVKPEVKPASLKPLLKNE